MKYFLVVKALVLIGVLSVALVAKAENMLVVIPNVSLFSTPFQRTLRTVCQDIQEVVAYNGLVVGRSVNFSYQEFQLVASGNSKNDSQSNLLLAMQNINRLYDTCAKLHQERFWGRLDGTDINNLRQLHDHQTTFVQDLNNATIKICDKANCGLSFRMNQQPKGGSGPAAPGLAARLGPLDVAGTAQEEVIKGIEEFMMKRAKAEMVFMFQQGLREDLCHAQSEASVYYPNLCRAFENMDANASLESMGTYLQKAAESDLKLMPELALSAQAQKYLADLKEPKPEEEKQKERQAIEAITTAQIGLAAFRESSNGRAPFSILRGLKDLGELPCEKVPEPCQVPRVIRTLAIALSGAEYVWQQKQTDVYDKNVTAIAAGFTIEDKVKRKDLFTEAELNEIIIFMDKAGDSITNIMDLTKAIQKPPEGQTPEQTRQQLISASTQSLELLINSSELLQAILTKVISNSGESPDQNLLNNLVQDLGILRDTFEFGSKLLQKDMAGMSIAMFSLYDRFDAKDKILPEQVIKYLPLIVEIGRAGSSEEVAKVLEIAAAPVGSYREKYKRQMISVTGIFGGAAGREFYQVKNQDQNRNAFSLFAPLGIHATFPIEKGRWGGKLPVWDTHLGGFLSVIDFGPYLSYSPEQGDLKSESNLGFQQVLAPGLYLTLGPTGMRQKYPLLLGFGAEYNPSLRKSEGGDNVSVIRVQAFVGIDLTLFPF